MGGLTEPQAQWVTHYVKGRADTSALTAGAQVTFGSASIGEETLGAPVGAGPASDTLYAFLAEDGSGPVDRKTVPTAAALNDSGHALQAAMAAALKHFMAWKHEVAVIEEDAKKGGGQAALESVKKASGAIGAHSRGNHGKGMRDDTQNYYDAISRSDAIVEKVAAQVDKYDAANHGFLAEMWKDAANKQKRVVDNAKDAVTEEEKKIEERKKEISEYFQLAEKLLKPQEWTEAAQTIGMFVAEKVADSVFASADKLETLKKKLDEAKQELANVEDSAQAEMIIKAQKTASAELHELNIVYKDFDRLAKDLKAARANVVEDLDNSPATKPAAQAVKKGEAIRKQANAAAGLVKAYLPEADKLLKDVIHLGERYRSYVAIVSQYGQGSKEWQASLSTTSSSNEAVCNDWADYLRVTRTQAAAAQDYLTKDTEQTFLSGYQDIPSALADASASRNL